MLPRSPCRMEEETTSLAVTAASSGAAPLASSAVTAAARVQPAPWTRSVPTASTSRTSRVVPS